MSGRAPAWATCRTAARSSRSSPFATTSSRAATLGPTASARSRRWCWRCSPISATISAAPAGCSPAASSSSSPSRALASAPKILLLDEPTEGIQPNIVELIQATIARLNRELGLTIVLVEQNVAFARAASRHFVIIETGMVAAQGPISALTDEVVHRHMTV
jgi:ABC-type histidine transport system ATPase subunit